MTRLDFGGEDDLNQLRDQSGLVHDQFGDHTGTTTLQQGYEQGDTRRGLVAYYPLDGDVNDATPLGNDGTDNTSAGYVTGQVGSQAKDFDGTDDIVDLNTPIISSQTNFTISAWAKLDSISSDSTLVDQRDTFAFYYSDASSGYIMTVRESSGTGFSATSNGNESAGEWNHITGVVKPSLGEISIYINGVLEDEVTPAWDGTYEGFPDTTIGLRGDGTFPMDGIIDDVRIYDRVLSQPEIQALANLTETETINNEDVLQ